MTGRGVLAMAVTAVVTAGCLAACGSDGGTTDGKAGLQIWVRKPPGSSTEKTDQQLAAAFTAKTGVPAHVTALFDDFETKLQQAAAQKKLPDIVINDTDRLGGLVKQGLVREVDRDKLAGQADLTPSSWQAATGADGKIYGVPFSAQSFALFIRKDWRERLGRAIPTTWAELDDLAKAFTTCLLYTDSSSSPRPRSCASSSAPTGAWCRARSPPRRPRPTRSSRPARVAST